MEDSAIRAAGLGVGVVPALLMLFYFAAAGRTRMDDGDLWNCFAVGACVALPIGLTVFGYEAIVGYPDGVFKAALAKAFIGAAVPEEAFKLIGLLGICGRQLRHMGASRIIVLGVATSCGFAALENVFYVVLNDNWIGVAALRCMSSVPGHAFMGAVMGACIAKAVRGGQRVVWWAVVWWGLAYLTPVLMHGIYNFWLISIVELRSIGEAGPPGVTEWLVIGFIATVISEGLIAHLCLRFALRRDEQLTPEPRVGTSLPAPLGWLARPAAPVVFWSVASGLFLLAAMGGFWITETDEILVNGDPSALWLLRGYGAFAMLHGLAFAGLAIVMRRRNAADGGRNLRGPRQPSALSEGQGSGLLL